MEYATLVGVSTSELLKAAAVGKQLGVSDETVRRWAKAGKLRHVTLPSGKVRFRQADVDEYLNPAEQSDPAA